jgi:chaperonin GroES
MATKVENKQLKLVPLFDRILIEVEGVETVSKGGIVLPDVVQEGPQRGTVVRCGLGPLTSSGEYGPMPVAPGTDVLFERGSERTFEIGQQSFCLIRLQSIIGILSDS